MFIWAKFFLKGLNVDFPGAQLDRDEPGAVGAEAEL